MSYQALYRKYRPATFSEVVGQEHITETLKNELSSGTQVHAYLFTGTRGTGKTSCAKILAKALNCTKLQNGDPCLVCESCRRISSGENTDIAEIDAASNNSVDSIRELRDQVAFNPVSSKYRVYIIDEVHMLSISAFNALLKTLEEPPAHVVFILATTEVHKLPATILSRCQRFDFKRIEPEKICERIDYIAGREGLTVTPEAAALIASAADGGMRDALSILDLCASAGRNIDEDLVANVCGMAGNDYLVKLSGFIKQRDVESALLLLDELHTASVDMLRLLSELIGHYRDLMIIKTVKGGKKPIVCSAARLKALEEQAADYDIKEIMRALSVLQSCTASMQTGSRRCEMEMAVIRLCEPALSGDFALLESRISALERTVGQIGFNSAVSTAHPEPKPASQPAPDIENEIPPEQDYEPADFQDAADTAEPQENNGRDGAQPLAKWDAILKVLGESCPLMAGVLKGSRAFIKGNYLLIDSPNSQFRSLINSKNGLYRDSIRKAAHQVLGVVYKLGPYSAMSEKKSEDPLAVFAEKLKSFEIN